MSPAIFAAFSSELLKIAEKINPRIFKQFSSHPSAIKNSPLNATATRAKLVSRGPALTIPKPSDVGGHAFVPKKALSIPGLTD